MLKPFYIISEEEDPKQNPLYLATDHVEEELLLCPDAIINKTQVRPLIKTKFGKVGKSAPFCVLQLRENFRQCSTEQKRKSNYAMKRSSNQKRKVVVPCLTKDMAVIEQAQAIID